MPFWFGFGRGELFFKRRAPWPCAKDHTAWRRRLLFRFILRLLGRQSKRMQNNDTMIPKNDDSIIQETGPLAVCEGSARLKMMPFWFGFGRRKLFFKRRAVWPCAKDQPAWRRRPLFHLILRLSGWQSERRENNVMCSSTIIEHKNESVAKQLQCCSRFESC